MKSIRILTALFAGAVVVLETGPRATAVAAGGTAVGARAEAAGGTVPASGALRHTVTYDKYSPLLDGRRILV